MGQLCGTAMEGHLHNHKAEAQAADLHMKCVDKHRCPKHPDVNLRVGWGKTTECYRCKMEFEVEIRKKSQTVDQRESLQIDVKPAKGIEATGELERFDKNRDGYLDSMEARDMAFTLKREEQQRAEEQRRLVEEQKRLLEDERRRLDDQKRREERRLLEEERRLLMEAQKQQEQQRVLAEQRKAVEEEQLARIRNAQRELEEQKRALEEQKRVAALEEAHLLQVQEREPDFKQEELDQDPETVPRRNEETHLNKEQHGSKENVNKTIDDPCGFCGRHIEVRSGDDGSEDALDKHWFNECPLLTSCPHCDQFVEITDFFNHIISKECESAPPHQTCPRCRAAIPSAEFSKHVETQSCPEVQENQVLCPLCREIVDTKSLEKHLMSRCSKNPRIC